MSCIIRALTALRARAALLALTVATVVGALTLLRSKKGVARAAPHTGVMQCALSMSRNALEVVFVLGLLATLALAPIAPRRGGVEAAPATFTANSNDDLDDGTCDATHCSLREAIVAANRSAATDTIGFNIPGAGPHTIQLASLLPTITDPAIIDGYTQPGASPNTNGPGLGTNAVLMIEIDGSKLGPRLWDLGITAGNSTVRGLVINRAPGPEIYLAGNGDNVIEGNFIGTDVTGTVGFGIGGGIFVESSDRNTIGGTTAGARNLISGHLLLGIEIVGHSDSNLVQGNLIGTDATGVDGLGNGLHGVVVKGSYNTIGGATTAAGNTIAFTPGSGVAVGWAAIGNAILSNSIFANGTLGIDLGLDGVTPNDPGDLDTGPNKLQNFPVLTSVVRGSSTTIEGVLNSAPDTEFNLQFFSNSECDPSGYGEGEEFLGSTMVTTDGSGDASFVVTIPQTVPAGRFITATATDPDNNTSEFSQCLEVPEGLTPVPTPTPTSTPVGTANTIVVSPPDSGVVTPGDTFTVDIELVGAPLGYRAVQAQLEWDAAALEYAGSAAGSLVTVPARAAVHSGDPPGTEQVQNMGGIVAAVPVNWTGQVWSVTLRCDLEGGPYTLHLVPFSEDPENGTATAAVPVQPGVPPHAMVLEDGRVECREPTPACTPPFTPIVPDDTDCDGAPDDAELGPDPTQCGTRDPNNPWDFYDVPAPSLSSGGSMNNRDSAVTILNDVLAVLEYTGISPTFPCNGGPDLIPGNEDDRCYDQDKDGDGYDDGLAYDRSVGATWSAPPDGAITILEDVLLVLAQTPHRCPP